MLIDGIQQIDKIGNIHIIRGEKDSRFPFCNSIFIDDEIRAVIDPSAGLGKMEKIAAKGIHWVINSHFHFDHIAFNYLFEDADVYVHELDQGAMTNLSEFTKKYGATKVLGESWIKELEEKLDDDNTHAKLNSFTFNTNFYRSIGRVDHTYTDGDVFRFGEETAEVIHTPGHADSMCCFFSHDTLCCMSAITMC